MARYRVYLQTIASTSIEVDVSDDLGPEEARDAAIDAAYDETPGLCFQCAGYDRPGIELGGEWELPKVAPDWDPVERVGE